MIELRLFLLVFLELEVLEFVFDGPIPGKSMEELEQIPCFYMVVQKQKFEGYYCGDGKYKVRFMPKAVGEWEYELESEIKELNGQKGAFVSVPEAEENRQDRGQGLKNWWADILDAEYAEGEHQGAKTVSQWRKENLTVFAERFNRCL